MGFVLRSFTVLCYDLIDFRASALEFASDFVSQVWVLQTDLKLLASVFHDFFAQSKAFEDFSNDNFSIAVAKVGFCPNQDTVAVLLRLEDVEQERF